MKKPLRILAGLAIFAFFVYAAGRAADQEFASAGASKGHNSGSFRSASAGGVLTEREGGAPAGWRASRAPTSRSVSACGASSIGPDGRVTVTSCGERLSERDQRTRDTFQEGSPRRAWTDVAELNERGLTSSDPIRAARSESLYQAHNSVPFRTATPGKAASIRAIRQVFGRRAAPAIRVASCETGGTFYARSVGNAGERGLFQIHPIHFSWAQPRRLFDPVWNSRVAYRLSRGGTRWGPWSCRWAA